MQWHINVYPWRNDAIHRAATKYELLNNTNIKDKKIDD